MKKKHKKRNKKRIIVVKKYTGNLKNKKKKNKVNSGFKLLVLICFFLFVFFALNISENSGIRGLITENRWSREKDKKEYEDCINNPLDDIDKIKEIKNIFLNNLINNYDVALLYEDLSTGFTVSLNANKTFYAASTIKLLDALYIYEKARLGEINLEEKVLYEEKHVVGGLDDYQVGDYVSVRELVKRAILVSDNVAHVMLVDYIGFDNLKAYGNSLGANSTLTGGDNFGNITAFDGSLYLKHLNTFLNIKDKYSEELYDLFLNADQKYFAPSNINVLHKYGNYSYFYNDLSIVYDDKPYVLALLTHYGDSNYNEKVAEIQELVYKFNHTYQQTKKEYCYDLVYKKTED